MPNRALSKRVKAAKRAKVKEDKLRRAVKAYAEEQAKPPELRQGVHAIAIQFGIPEQYKTITNCYKGGRSRGEAHEDLQKLMHAEQAVLVNFIEESANRGF